MCAECSANVEVECRCGNRAVVNNWRANVVKNVPVNWRVVLQVNWRAVLQVKVCVNAVNDDVIFNNGKFCCTLFTP